MLFRSKLGHLLTVFVNAGMRLPCLQKMLKVVTQKAADALNLIGLKKLKQSMATTKSAKEAALIKAGRQCTIGVANHRQIMSIISAGA